MDDNNSLTLHTNNFSIASLITSVDYNDENNLYHSMTNSLGSNIYLNHYSIDKITQDYYPNSIQEDFQQFLPSNEQQPTKKKESRTKTNPRKPQTTKGHMEGLC
jgi:hypothetical protein